MRPEREGKNRKIHAAGGPKICEQLARFKGDGSFTVAQVFGKEWLLQKRSPVLSVPSSVIRIERNFVLNPHHEDFAKIGVKPAAKLSRFAALEKGLAHPKGREDVDSPPRQEAKDRSVRMDRGCLTTSPSGRANVG